MAASVAAAAGAAFAGYTGASKAPLEGTAAKAASAGAAAIAGGAVLAGAQKLNSERGQAAGVELWNAIVDSADPSNLDPSIGQMVRQKYGTGAEASEGIKQNYAAYLEALIPPGSTALHGDEAVKLREFLTATGLSEEDAAPAHIDVGRAFFRARLEVSDREEQTEGFRRFQKLVYVSSQLFGDVRSGFLTPWVARFKVTPEQVMVAKRNGAQAIMSGRIARELGGKVPTDAAALRMLRDVQTRVGLPDDACAVLVRGIIATDVEARLDEAIAVMKQRGASIDYSHAVAALDGLLADSRAYEALAAADAAAEAPAIVPGVGALTVAGTRYAREGKNDLVDLFKLYAEAKVDAAGTALPAALEADLAALVALLDLPDRKAADVKAVLINESYQKLLREAVSSGRMDEAESPAAVLNELITRVSMPGEQALALHTSMYAGKLRDCLADKRIDDDDAAALARTARLLCLSDEAVAEADAAQKGEVLRSVIRAAMDVGLDVFGSEQVEAVERAKADLRVADDAAFDVLASIGRAELAKRLNAARNKSNKLDNAKELKQVVYFSNIVLAPLVQATKGRTPEDKKADAMKEIAETMAKAREQVAAEEAAEKAGAEGEGAKEDPTVDVTADADADGDVTQPASLAKAEKAKKEREEAGDSVTTDGGKEVRMGSQKDITVAADFAMPERVDIYRTYLMYCMTGDVIQLPMGGTITVERDEQEFARLSQLGDVLGLGPMDVYEVHSSMAEEAFKSQAEMLAPNGDLSADTLTQLEEMAEKMGIGTDKSQRIIRGITNRRLIGNLQNMQSQGALTLEKILEFKEQDIDVETVLGESMRTQLYEKHIDQVLSSGEGTVDVERLLTGLPADLKLDAAAVSRKAATVAKAKARTIMVQAISYFRQKNHGEATRYLNNLLACARVSGGDIGEAAKWGSKEELLDVFGLYCQGTKDTAVREEMARTLRLSDGDRDAVQGAVDSGTFGKAMASAGGDKGKDTGSIF